MNPLAAQQEIDSILKTLNEAEQYSGLSLDDPSVVALEKIMLAKVAALEAANPEESQAPDAVALDPAGEHAASPEPPLLFAPPEDETGR